MNTMQVVLIVYVLHVILVALYHKKVVKTYFIIMFQIQLMLLTLTMMVNTKLFYQNLLALQQTFLITTVTMHKVKYMPLFGTVLEQTFYGKHAELKEQFVM